MKPLSFCDHVEKTGKQTEKKPLLVLSCNYEDLELNWMILKITNDWLGRYWSALQMALKASQPEVKG